MSRFHRATLILKYAMTMSNSSLARASVCRTVRAVMKLLRLPLVYLLYYRAKIVLFVVVPCTFESSAMYINRSYTLSLRLFRLSAYLFHVFCGQQTSHER